MKRVLSNWNFVRALRLLLGLAIVGQGFWVADWQYILAGGVFSLLPLLNIGCCAGSACGVSNAGNGKDINDVVYEEIH